MKKPQAIKKILEETKGSPPKYFDKLSDRSEVYLNKLLSVIKLLK